MEIDRYDECSTGATVHRSGTDYCVFLSNAAPFDGVARRREVTEQGEHLHFQGLPLRERGRCIFFLVIIQPSSPFFHRFCSPPLSFAYSTTTPPSKSFYPSVRVILSSPFNHPTLHIGVEEEDDDNHPPTSLDDSSAEEAATIEPRRIVGFRTSFDGLSRARYQLSRCEIYRSFAATTSRREVGSLRRSRPR